jgi:hypothetical protein
MSGVFWCNVCHVLADMMLLCRLVDVYNPEWATLREVRKAVIRFKAEYALGRCLRCEHVSRWLK